MCIVILNLTYIVVRDNVTLGHFCKSNMVVVMSVVTMMTLVIMVTLVILPFFLVSPV